MRRHLKNDSAAAASATCRKAVNGIAKALNQEPSHSSYPGLDLDTALQSLPDAIKEKALEWYIRGIKRGMAKATDMMASKDVYIDGDGIVRAPMKIMVKVRVKFEGGVWESMEIPVESEEIGFDSNI